MSDLVLRQLWEAVHKHTNSLHVFICPRLMMPVWGRLMLKMVDLVVYVPPGEMFWPSSMHESFVICFIYPLIPHRTWWIRGTTKVLGLVRTVSLLIQESPGYEWSVMSQLWLLTKRVASISGVFARVLIIS